MVLDGVRGGSVGPAPGPQFEIAGIAALRMLPTCSALELSSLKSTAHRVKPDIAVLRARPLLPEVCHVMVRVAVQAAVLEIAIKFSIRSLTRTFRLYSSSYCSIVHSCRSSSSRSASRPAVASARRRGIFYGRWRGSRARRRPRTSTTGVRWCGGNIGSSAWA
jgi:hypothetical protein